MKRADSGKVFNVTFKTEKDFHWKVLTCLARDLGASERTHPELFGIIRNRDASGLLAFGRSLEPRCMLDSGSYVKKADAFAFFRNYQLSVFLKKFPHKKVGDTKMAAVKDFLSAEKECSLFNRENFRAIQVLNECHPNYLGIIEEIQNDILSILGEFPDLDSIGGCAKHGPGVSLGSQYEDGMVTEFYKWSSLPYTVTSGTLPYARSVIESDQRWLGALDDWYRRTTSTPIFAPIDLEKFWSSVFKVVDSNRIAFVPKTALIDRPIAIEPLLNLFLQLGADCFIRRRLKRLWRYDLNSQELNQVLAYEASITNEMVTVDLKGASDSVALMCVYMLLPPGWVDFLLDLRSPKGDLEGSSLSYEKLSSMGNGFTFAIESLIFGALVRAAIRRTKSVKKSAVYGDDLIVPTTAYPFLQELLSLFGFRLNKDKTFSNGPFRESCGRDFFLGYDVRPVFLKSPITHVKDLFTLHNAFFLLERRLDWTWGVSFPSTLALIRKNIPRNIRDFFYGPSGESVDTHIFSDMRLPINPQGERNFWQLIAKPKVFKPKAHDFFFRKLMCSLRPSGHESHYIWDKKRRLNTGNAFDITRRDRVEITMVNTCLPYPGRHNHKPLPTSQKP